MRTLKSSLILLFVFITSISILLDGSNHSVSNISDKYEEISIVANCENSLHVVSNVVDKKVINANNTFNNKVKNLKLAIFSRCLNFNSKIKSYLHLLHLF